MLYLSPEPTVEWHKEVQHRKQAVYLVFSLGCFYRESSILGSLIPGYVIGTLTYSSVNKRMKGVKDWFNTWANTPASENTHNQSYNPIGTRYVCRFILNEYKSKRYDVVCKWVPRDLLLLWRERRLKWYYYCMIEPEWFKEMHYRI